MMGTLFGAIIGALCAGFLFVTGFNLTWDLNSSNFLGAVLSALGALMGLVSVLLGVVALAIGIGAFFGWQALKEGTKNIARDVATREAVASAQEAAEPAAKAIAASKVEQYMLANEATIRDQVASAVGQVLTPEFVSAILRDAGVLGEMAKAREAGGAVNAPAGMEPDQAFSADVIAEAAVEEEARQEKDFNAFDAAVEADIDRDEGETQGTAQ